MNNPLIFDREKAYGDMLEIFNNIGKISNSIEQGQAYLIRVPDFLEAVWMDGLKKGIEIGKQQKIQNILKQN